MKFLWLEEFKKYIYSSVFFILFFKANLCQIYEQFQKGENGARLSILSVNNTKTTNLLWCYIMSYCREKIKDIHIINLFWLLFFCVNGSRVYGEKTWKTAITKRDTFHQEEKDSVFSWTKNFFSNNWWFLDKKIVNSQLPATRTEFYQGILILFGIKIRVCLSTASCHCRRIFHCRIKSSIFVMVYWIWSWIVWKLLIILS